MHLGKVESLEINVADNFVGCEWRYLDEKGQVIHESNNQYGNPMAALRDGLVAVIGLPNDSSMHKIAQARDIITAHFK